MIKDKSYPECSIRYKALDSDSSASLAFSNTHLSVKGNVKVWINFPYMLLTQHLAKFVHCDQLSAQGNEFEYIFNTYPSNAEYAIPIVSTCQNASISKEID